MYCKHRLKKVVCGLSFAAVFSLAGASGWADTEVTMRAVTPDGTGESYGTITVKETEYGVVFQPELKGLPEGMHGFHVHENGECGPEIKDGDVTPGGAAGGHFDPRSAGHHDAPWSDGHLGDLPALYVDGGGKATYPVQAPRLEYKMLNGRSIIIHQNGDNYADKPKPLGGGGPRIACGVIR